MTKRGFSSIVKMIQFLSFTNKGYKNLPLSKYLIEEKALV